MKHDFKILPLFRDYLRAHTPDEHEVLRALIQEEGCRPGALVAGVFPDGVLPEGTRFLVDGHNSLSICAEEEIKPCEAIERKFTTVTEAIEWIAEHHHGRRNQSQEEIQAERERRSKRIVAARESGKSERAIAEEENVSRTTVQRVLNRQVAQGGPPAQVASPSTTSGTAPVLRPVVGKDGKTYTNRAKILCARCIRIGGRVEGCQQCCELRLKAKGGQSKRAAKPSRNGKVLRDFKREWDAAYGVLVRLMASMREELDVPDRGPFDGFRRCGNGLIENFKEAWNMVRAKRKLKPENRL